MLWLAGGGHTWSSHGTRGPSPSQSQPHHFSSPRRITWNGWDRPIPHFPICFPWPGHGGTWLREILLSSSLLRGRSRQCAVRSGRDGCLCPLTREHRSPGSDNLLREPVCRSPSHFARRNGPECAAESVVLSHQRRPSSGAAVRLLCAAGCAAACAFPQPPASTPAPAQCSVRFDSVCALVSRILCSFSPRVRSPQTPSRNLFNAQRPVPQPTNQPTRQRVLLAPEIRTANRHTHTPSTTGNRRIHAPVSTPS